MSEAILGVENATIRYGRVEAVRDVSMSVPAGAIVTIIGANGAGKSTLLNAVMGLVPLEGTVRFLGEDCRHGSTQDRVRRGLVLISERRELFGSMSVEENLALGAFTRPAGSKATLAEVYELFPRLRERRRQTAHTLSGGERQMLAMGRAMMAHPRLLMLDEPSLGLAPRIVGEIFEIIVRMRAAGVSIVLVEQNARAALEVADRAHVMEHGRFTLAGTGAEIRADPRVEEIYLGGTVT